ncbi:SDR family NAD(P)-dependent oxidoreductase [Parvularcula oceani]|uniref:SDR family NAD(P)-dependent oxidoreductase n=1 Tax=Parvularcula oceani TaxID=1247963 RepID=UPI0004E22FE9|nr:SDR family NAD(P)-dependent oxidoreductase [Parvularcula oceani]
MTIRFDDRVAIVTGAGGGLGRTHALALAERGAKVVVNDLGGSVDGSGGSSEAADRVVEEIRQAGGTAVADGASVSDETGVDRMVARTIEEFGRVDILVNNAGILRDKSFAKMEVADWDAVIDVHLRGTFLCTKAVWGRMRDQGYGRIVLTTSSSGLYGNFGQSNYGAAKMAMVGLMNTLHLEGAKYDIRTNCLAPAAATRMTENLGIPEEAMALMTPESVSAGLVYLASEDAPRRAILAAAAGGFALAKIYETDGVWLAPGEQTPEAVRDAWDRIADASDQKELQQGGEQSAKFLQKAAASLKG